MKIPVAVFSLLVLGTGCYRAARVTPTAQMRREDFVRDSIKATRPSTGALFLKALADGLAAYSASTAAPQTLTSTPNNEMYKLEGMTRISQDIYRSGKFYIETQYCFHFAYTELALYHKTKRKVIWRDDSTCDVKAIYTK